MDNSRDHENALSYALGLDNMAAVIGDIGTLRRLAENVEGYQRAKSAILRDGCDIRLIGDDSPSNFRGLNLQTAVLATERSRSDRALAEIKMALRFGPRRLVLAFAGGLSLVSGF
jgi:hypothetical protein